MSSMDSQKAATAYNRMMSRVPYGFYARRVLNDGIREGRLLDIAYGPGQLLMALAKQAPELELTGVDISQHILDEARTNFTKAGLDQRITLTQGSFLEMPFPDKSFDIVVNTNALHYVEEPVRFFNEIVRVLKEDGIGVIADYRRDTPGWVRSLAYLQTRFNAMRGIPLEGFGRVIDACYTKSEIEDFLESSNANKWEVRQSYFLPLTITIYG